MAFQKDLEEITRDRRFYEEPTLKEKISLKFADFIPIIGFGNYFYRIFKIHEPCNDSENLLKSVSNTLIMTIYHGVFLCYTFKELF